MAMPALALEPEWIAYFRNNFPVNKQSSYTAGYTCTIQRFLMCGSTRELIENHGGIDGIFGTYTTEAVKIFQGSVNLTKDGSVGPNTWAAIGNCLTEEGEYFCRGLANVIYIVNSSNNKAYLYYCDELGEPGGWFHTVTFS